jgi:hypothetical protein
MNRRAARRAVPPRKLAARTHERVLDESGEHHVHGFGTAIPIGDDVTLWRYMPFVKFVAMIETRSLHMTRGDKFQDGHEGSLALANAEIQARNQSASPSRELMSFSHFELGRRYTEVSCWHRSEHENSVMWAGYGSADAVAIKTSSNRLRAATKKVLITDPHVHRVGLYPVTYIDFDTGEMDLATSPFLYKRAVYAAENEVRLIRESWTPRVTFRTGQEPEVADDPPAFPETGTDLRVSSDLYEEIVLSPTAATWQTELVGRLAKRFHIEAPVRRSTVGGGKPRF